MKEDTSLALKHFLDIRFAKNVTEAAKTCCIDQSELYQFITNEKLVTFQAGALFTIASGLPVQFLMMHSPYRTYINTPDAMYDDLAILAMALPYQLFISLIEFMAPESLIRGEHDVQAIPNDLFEQAVTDIKSGQHDIDVGKAMKKVRLESEQSTVEDFSEFFQCSPKEVLEIESGRNNTMTLFVRLYAIYQGSVLKHFPMTPYFKIRDQQQKRLMIFFQCIQGMSPARLRDVKLYLRHAHDFFLKTRALQISQNR